MAQTGTVKFSALNSGHNTIIGGNGAYTQYALAQEGSFPSSPYKITSATLTYTVRTKDNGNIWNWFFVNRTNAPTAQLGKCNANGEIGEHIQTLTTENLYEGLTNIALVGDGGSACQIRSNTYVIITVNWELTQTDATAPTWISYNPNPFDASLTVSWGGAAAGVNNPITSYKLRFYWWNGSAWSYNDYTTSNTSYTINTATYGSQQQVKASVQAIATYNTTAFYDGATASKIKITAPTAPTAITGNTPFENSLTISWSGAAAGSNNAIVGYTVYYSISTNGSTWGAETAQQTTNSSFTIDTTNTSRGTYYRFRIITRGSRSNSGYSSYSKAFRKNQLPPTPTITIPAAVTTTVYNTNPAVAASFGVEPDGQQQTLLVSIDGGAYAAASSTLPLKTTGEHTVKFAASDGLAMSNPTTAFTITVSTDLPTKNPATVAAADINKMRSCINSIRQYRGLATAAFADTIVSGNVVKASHFQELQSALPWKSFTKIKQNDLIKASHYNEIYNAILGG